MSQFCRNHKVGDKVTIVDRVTLKGLADTLDSAGHAGYVSDLLEYSGEEMTVVDGDGMGFYTMAEDNGNWFWEDACFTDYVEKTACKQTTPPHEGKTKVLDYVVSDLQARAEMGKSKYGHYLETGNGRNALQDAYEEALDMCMYLKQKLLEEDGK
jgi:hypothetical protein